MLLTMLFFTCFMSADSIEERSKIATALKDVLNISHNIADKVSSMFHKIESLFGTNNQAVIVTEPKVLPKAPEILTDDLIEKINQHQAWVAGRNFPAGIKKKELKSLGGFLGLHPDGVTMNEANVSNYPSHQGLPVPSWFDAREKWPHCMSLFEVRDQGRCAACWAFAVVAAMSDRLCIHSNGTDDFILSPEDLLGCCSTCGSCNGGYMWPPFQFYIEKGVVSGGDFGSNQGCLPYGELTYKYKVTPTCKQVCSKDYKTKYDLDKQYGSWQYQLPRSAHKIQQELITNGPLVVQFKVYADFLNYQSGVYRHVEGQFLFNHMAKIIGWGTLEQSPYWLLANSWGKEWGDKGFVKILRGHNECGIENYANAALPRL